MKEQANLTLNENEILDLVKDKFQKSLELRMRSDVKIGVLLSGGLDSSIILGSLNRGGYTDIPSYSVGFEKSEAYENEFKHARMVANCFNSELHEVVVTENDFFKLLPKMAYFMDEPIADTANIPLYLVSRRAQADHVKVLLSGEGADELFVGYEHWRLIYQFEKFMRNRPNLAAVLHFLHKKSFLKNKGSHYQMWAYKIKNKWPVFWGGTELGTEKDKRGALSETFLEKIGDYNSFDPFKDLYASMEEQKPYDTFKWMSILDLQNRLPDFLLARLDRMTMAASVEGRNPFLDENLIELALRISPELKIKEKKEKYILKKAFTDLLPDEIINRKKDSFSVPMKQLFAPARINEYRELIYEFNARTKIFKEDYLERIEKPENIKEYWNVLNLALWYEQHN